MYFQSNRIESRISPGWIEPSPTPASTAKRPVDTAARMALMLLIVAASMARIALLDAPFARNHESTASGPMVCAARNLVRYGMWSQKFCGVLNTGRVPQDQWVWYAHHPPLVVMTIAWSSKLFGNSEWCYRFPSALFSVLGTALIFIMIDRRFGWRTALTAGAIHAFIPFAWMFAGMPDVVGPHMVFFGLATIECYSRWFDTRKRLWLGLMVTAFTFCALSDWSAYFMPPVLAMHYLLSHHWRKWHRAALRISPFAIYSALLLVGLGAMLYLTPDKTLFKALFSRIDGTVDGTDIPITWKDWWTVGIGQHMLWTYTPLIAVLGALYMLWAGFMMLRLRRDRLARHDTAIMTLLWGLLHVVVGMQSSYQHMWVWVVLTPGMAMAAALVLRAICRALPEPLTAHRAAGIAVLLIAIAFAGHNFLRANKMTESAMEISERPTYTVKDIGLFIKAYTAPTDGVLTSDATNPVKGDSEPGMWFYADRQMRLNIRTPQELEQALKPGAYQIFYRYIQPGGPVPKWFVMPTEHYLRFPELSRVLDARYERWDLNGFILYYLPNPPRPDQGPTLAAPAATTQPVFTAVQ